MGCAWSWGVVALSACAIACGAQAQPAPAPTYAAPVAVRTKPVDKIDLLFMIDNSPGMGDKQALLAQSVPRLLDRLLQPATGFPPVHDMHIGIVDSSLGGRGSDQCDDSQDEGICGDANIACRPDDQGHLINRGGANESAVADAWPSNFLAWLPTVKANDGAPAPPVPPVGDPAQLLGDFQDLISGVHEHGCGFEAQNEAWYRFLVQPDPFAEILKSGTHAQLQGVDPIILQQRHDFLRPDSLLAVVVVTDENEEVADPLAILGQGWAFENTSFPGSPNGAAPKGTIECSTQDASDPTHTGPNDPRCSSCAFHPEDCPDGSYYDPADDNLNVRFFHQKQRFGLFAGYPVGRYVVGLTSPLVPSVGLAFDTDHDHEHDAYGNYVGDQPGHQNCVNPLYAASLPTDPTADLCHLARGPRTPEMVFYAAIAGVPDQLLGAQPQTDDDWIPITGRDPEHYDFRGADFHMLESEGDRPGSTCPSATAADDCDPVNGREWNTAKGDLQFACIFDIRPLYGGVGKDCSQAQYFGACDCVVNGQTRDTPLCLKDPSAAGADPAGYTVVQTHQKAYPSVREMLIARRLGAQGIASSICPAHVTEATAGDPLFAYRPAMDALVDRMAPLLGPPCLAQPLPLSKDGEASCVMLATLPDPGDESACAGLPGFAAPAPDVLVAFREQQLGAWNLAGGARSGAPDPRTLPVCELAQLPPGCAGSPAAGWCYATGGACGQSVAFAGNAGAVAGATFDVMCAP